jgi:DNA-binding winged helix-turn-helix (wHTH) protein
MIDRRNSGLRKASEYIQKSFCPNFEAMNAKSFVLFHRFMVEPSFNLVKDQETGIETRLEPRLVKLLCLLHEQQGDLVSREQITKTIWDDYGNADEGLTQAISYLRKILGDESKTLIETIPKKGYRMKKSGKKISVAPRPDFRKVLIWFVVIVAILAVGWFVFKPTNKISEDKPANISQPNSAGGADKVK